MTNCFGVKLLVCAMFNESDSHVVKYDEGSEGIGSSGAFVSEPESEISEKSVGRSKRFKLQMKKVKKKRRKEKSLSIAEAFARVGHSVGGAKSLEPAAKAAKPRKSSATLYRLKYRVSEETYKQLRVIFGDFENGVGPLVISAEWSALKSLGSKYFGEGRWLPAKEIGRGKEAGLSWTMLLKSTTEVWSEDTIKRCHFKLRYPSGKTSKLDMTHIFDSEIVAEYGLLRYYKTTGVPRDKRYFLKSSTTIGHITNFVARYFVSGDTYFMIDDAAVSLEDCLPPSEIDDNGTMRPWRLVHPTLQEMYLRTLRAAGAVVSSWSVEPNPEGYYGIVPVPRELVDSLYLRAAGRERDPRLLRDLMRHAEILVTGSKRVPASMKGVVASKLAFLALSHNAENEAKMYRDILPGSLRLNRVAKDAWAGKNRWYDWFHLNRTRTFLILIATFYYFRRNIVKYYLNFVKGAGRSAVDLVKQLLNKVFEKSTPTANSWLLTMGSLLGALRSRLGAPKGDLYAMERSMGADILWIYAEELLKRSHPVMPLVVCAVEGYGRFRRYLPTAAMHLLTAALPKRIAVPIHYLYNSVPSHLIEGRLKDHAIYDSCVDEPSLRDNEAVVGNSKLVMPQKLPIAGRLPCNDSKVSIHYIAFGIEGVEVEVSRSCICNERAAVMSRVTSVDNSENLVWPQWWSSAKVMGKVTMPEMQDWIQHLPSRARGLLVNANIYNPVKKDLVIKAFIKREKRVAKVGAKIIKPTFAPRLIQGRSVPIKVATGPFTWAYGKKLMQLYDLGGKYLYAGGRSAEEIGVFFDLIPERIQVEGARWWAVDCKRWDRSVGPTQLEMLWKEFKACGAPQNCLNALSNRSGVSKGVTRSGIKYHRVGQVSSGDGDTSSGNSRIHLVLHESCDFVLASIVHGDDALIYAVNIDGVLDHYVAGGFTPVLADCVDFCSSFLYPTRDGSVLGPKIGRVLGKTFYSMYKSSNGNYMPWLRGVCLSLRASCSFVPILRVLVPRLLVLAGEGDVYEEHGHQYKSFANSMHDVCEGTWEFLYSRYGLSESDIRSLEDKISQCELGIMKDETLLAMIMRDC